MMAVPLNTPETPSRSERALRQLVREQKRNASERKTVWTVVWTLFGFKMATVGLIWYAASGSREANDMLIATTWYWLFIPVVALSGIVAYRIRLYRIRRRRNQLHSSEWMAHQDQRGDVMSDEELRLLFLPDGRHDRGEHSSF